METDSVRLLAESLAPLSERFGNALSLARERNCVQWSYAGHAAIVEFVPGDRVRATFVAAPQTDAISAAPVSAVYQPNAGGYRLCPSGGAQMADDMIAFFSGIREPRFRFVGAFTPA